MPTLRLCTGTTRPEAASNTTRSPIVMMPPVGISSPATQRIVLVFPQPDWPSSTSDSPSGMVRSSPLIAVTPL
jgi:hypothetical protein